MNGPRVAAIAVSDLRKSYGPLEAVKGVSFEIAPGEVFALLGPNGAGKTTTVEILEGYRPRDGGSVSVLGMDPERGGVRLRERVGIVLQECGIEELLTPREVLERQAGYYPSPRPVDEMIALVDLADKATARIRTLSGGQRRRLDLALALVGDPELLFLDEPTTGFDPQARRHAWDLVKRLCKLGKTIFLTTHYMEEAQYLADRVAVIAAGLALATRAAHSHSIPDGPGRRSFSHTAEPPLPRSPDTRRRPAATSATPRDARPADATARSPRAGSARRARRTCAR